TAPWVQSRENRFRVVLGASRKPPTKAAKVSLGIAVGQSGRLTKLGLLASVTSPQHLSARRAANSLASMPPNDQPPSQTLSGNVESSSSSHSSSCADSSTGSGSISTRKCSSSPRSAAANGSNGEMPKPQPGSKIRRSLMGGLQLAP